MNAPAPDEARPRATAADRLRTSILVVNVAVTGLLFGVLQWSVFYLLQSYLASTAIVYLLGTCVWLAGTLVGLMGPGRRGEWIWMAGMMVAYYAFGGIAAAHPYDLRYLPLLLGMVAVMGAYAGRFFRYRADAFSAARWLFLIENTGFVAGLVFTVVALYYWSESVLSIAPAVLASIAFLTALAGHKPRSSRAHEARVTEAARDF